ncbi:MAG: alpha/beta fold hydrolase [Candidatus Brevundimonas colombiensis]|uniref:Alpha/beta fold hydrolase n=1 Tax=Candidatus Brevundimonas colombiensis TaxID=3121376 RepID=A0AAJ6BL79_9CAUL|nr:alpha/beta fold hydrolase [Brevundimonas sp.]WEK39739.1 MAG: alpha/beta fold hydrolase [Brevundimonas sp.]
MTPLVLIPGLACTAEMFAPQVAALSPVRPLTVASTLEGDSMARMAAAILRDAPPRFALGGVSMGGYIALEIMRQAPERVERLALMSTTARPDAPEQTAQRQALIARAEDGQLEAIMREIAPRLLHPLHKADQSLIDIQVRMGLDIGAAGFVRQQRAIIGRADSRPDLPGIRVPTLVLVGDRDPLTPPIRAREMADALPDAHLVIVPDCGHASTLEQPDAVNAALLYWLDA